MLDGARKRLGAIARRLIVGVQTWKVSNRGKTSGLGTVPFFLNGRLGVLVSITSAASFIGILLLYTHGNLLYGGDYTGFYSSVQFLRSPSPTAAIFTFSILLGGGDVYTGFYLGLFLSAFITCMGVYFFAGQLGRLVLIPRLQAALSVITTVLYLYNPYTITDTFKSVTTSVYPYIGAQFFFVALCVHIYTMRKAQLRVPLLEWAAAGAACGFSLQAFPNNVRIAVVSVILLALVLLLSRPTAAPRLRRSILVRAWGLLVLIGVAFLAGFYSISPYLSNINGTLTQSFQIGGSLGTNAFFLGGDYNQLPNVLRLLNPWGFTSGFAPYSGLYFAATPAAISSWMWPAIALFIPLLLVNRVKRPRVILTIELAMLLVIFWETSTNLPAGTVYLVLAKSSPLSTQLFPTGFLTRLVLTKLYPVMCACGVLLAGDRIRSLSLSKVREVKGTTDNWSPVRSVGTGRASASAAGLIVVIGLTACLLLVAMPTYTGMSEGQYFNSSAKGFALPHSYWDARSVALRVSGNLLLLPATQTYITTDWNYEGSVGFYSGFFYPAQVSTIDTLTQIGGYGQYSPSAARTLSTLTNPFVPDNSTYQTAVSSLDFSNIKVWGSPFNVSGSTISLQETASPHAAIEIPVSPVLNASGNSFLELTVDSPDAAKLAADFGSGSGTVGIQSSRLNATVGSTIGWYYPGIDGHSLLYRLGRQKLSIYMDVGELRQRYGTDIYNASCIDYIIIQFPETATGFVNSLTIASFGTVRTVTVSSSWISLVHSLDITSLLLDTSIDSGWSESPMAAVTLCNTMVSIGVASVLLRSGPLELLLFQLPPS